MSRGPLRLKVRLHKFIAEAGMASRRAAEGLMREGRVLVNGQPAREPGTQIDPARDEVIVDGHLVERGPRRTIALHKPRGYVCSLIRQGARQRLVSELLPADWHDLYPIGRLDRESEGLLLLTNDGDFCLRLTHPRYAVTKRYVATVVGKFPPALLKRLRDGIRDQGELLRARNSRLLSANASHSVVELELNEGKHHEVRRLFAALGFEVERLQRLQIGPIKLGELRPGRWRVLASAELEALRRQPGTEKTHVEVEGHGARTATSSAPLSSPTVASTSAEASGRRGRDHPRPAGESSSGPPPASERAGSGTAAGPDVDTGEGAASTRASS